MTICQTQGCRSRAAVCDECVDASMSACADIWMDQRRERDGFRSLLRYMRDNCLATIDQLSNITGLDRMELRALMDHHDREAP